MGSAETWYQPLFFFLLLSASILHVLGDRVERTLVTLLATVKRKFNLVSWALHLFPPSHKLE